MSSTPRSLVLSESERRQLARIAERGNKWRARKRSRTLFMLHNDTSIDTVTKLQGIRHDTVTALREAWLARGVNALMEANRSGAPRKLQAGHARTQRDLASAKAVSAPQLFEKLQNTFKVKGSI